VRSAAGLPARRRRLGRHMPGQPCRARAFHGDCLQGTPVRPFHSQLVKVSTLLCFLLPVKHALERCRSPCAPPIISSLCIRAQQHHACFPHLRWNKCGHKASNQVAFCMLQAERGGWLDAGACSELANVPAAAGSLPDAMSHSVQVRRRGLVPSALPAAWQTQERLLSQAAFHPRRTPSHLIAIYIGASLKAVLSCCGQLDGPKLWWCGAVLCKRTHIITMPGVLLRMQ